MEITAPAVPRTSEDSGSLLADRVVGAARLPRAALRAVRRRLGHGAGAQLASVRPGRRRARGRVLDHGPAAEGASPGHPTSEPGVCPAGPRVYGVAHRRADPPQRHQSSRGWRVTTDPRSGAPASAVPMPARERPVPALRPEVTPC